MTQIKLLVLDSSFLVKINIHRVTTSRQWAPSHHFTAKFVFTTNSFKVRHNTTRGKNSAVSWNEQCRDGDVEGSKINKKEQRRWSAKR